MSTIRNIIVRANSRSPVSPINHLSLGADSETITIASPSGWRLCGNDLFAGWARLYNTNLASKLRKSATSKLTRRVGMASLRLACGLGVALGPIAVDDSPGVAGWVLVRQLGWQAMRSNGVETL